MEGEAWQAKVHGVPKSRIRLSDFRFSIYILCKAHIMGFPGGTSGKESTY